MKSAAVIVLSLLLILEETPTAVTGQSGPVQRRATGDHVLLKKGDSHELLYADQDGFSSTDVAFNQLRSCPKTPFQCYVWDHIHLCDHDADCPGNKLCCTSRCGNVCFTSPPSDKNQQEKTTPEHTDG